MTRTPTDPNHDLSTRCHDRFTDYINKALLAGKTQFLGYFRGWETSEVCALVQPTHRKVVLAYFKKKTNKQKSQTKHLIHITVGLLKYLFIISCIN